MEKNKRGRNYRQINKRINYNREISSSREILREVTKKENQKEIKRGKGFEGEEVNNKGKSKGKIEKEKYQKN